MSIKRKAIPEKRSRRPPARSSAAVTKDWRKLATEQGVQPIGNFDLFLEDVGGVWPEKENLDDFLAWLKELRQDGRGEG